AAVYPTQPGLPGAPGFGGAISPATACSLEAGPDGAGGVAGLGTASFIFGLSPQNFMAAGQLLGVNESLTSLNGRYRMVLRTGFFLCTERPDGSSVCANPLPAGTAGDQLRMQTDGNLCLYLQDKVLSCSNTSAHAGAYLMVQEDGRVVVTDGVKTYWSGP
ncbi:MAG: hypothetical protein M3Y32_03930, partial [Pseudomonadota bacterium]|nr:hypothetical protein [Pseudomonadota bacterium]